MTSKEILRELKPLGRESYKRLLMANHGIREPFFGVPVSELKRLQKRLANDHALALELYETGNYDAMYLAGLIADDGRMTKRDLQRWADGAYARALAGATVAWVAAGSPHGPEMARKWIESAKPLVAAAGWATLGSLVSVRDDADLDLAELRRLLQRVEKTIRQAPDVVRSQMNSFLIAVGTHVTPLTELALEVGARIGPVTADLGANDCRIAFAPDSIRKAQKRGALGKKRKSAKC
jgi:3-methyladenine DNA glycosylase AlkD